MIGLSSATAAMLYLCFTLSILFGIWISQHYKSRVKKIVVEDQLLLVCEYCHYAYLGDQARKVTKCPQCQSFNKNNRYQPK